MPAIIGENLLEYDILMGKGVNSPIQITVDPARYDFAGTEEGEFSIVTELNVTPKNFTVKSSPGITFDYPNNIINLTLLDATADEGGGNFTTWGDVLIRNYFYFLNILPDAGETPVIKVQGIFYMIPQEGEFIIPSSLPPLSNAIAALVKGSI